ncbi:CCA tRNA nucleotidyltransferase [Chloroflexota bacterium]
MIEVKEVKPFIEPAASSVLNKVSNLLAEQGIKSYLVGGFVRDALLGRKTADIDIAVAADALEIALRIADAVGGRYVPLDEVNGVGRIVLAEGLPEFDFSTIQDDIEQDLARRDFTIDAMAIVLQDIANQPLDPSQLIDPFGGWNDLRRCVLRAVSETSFESDAVRLLRAVRLAAELDFDIDKGTETLIRRYSDLIAGVAGERVREEFLRILALSQVGQLVSYLDELGLLTAMIPEMGQTKGVEQPKEHFWEVFDHSIQTVAAVEFLLRQGDWKYASEEILAVVPWSAGLAQHFDREVSHGSTRSSLLKLAALLHDIAKPQTKAIDENGRLRFLGHGPDGAAMAADILERLRFSAKEVKLVEIMVTHHLRPGQMSQNELPSRRAIYRYFRDTGEAGVDVLFLSLADHLATRGPNLNLANWQEHAQMVDYVLTQHFQEESLVAPPKLVDGHDLLSIFGMNPGPEVGELLEVIHEAQAAGELRTREEVLSYIKHYLSTLPPVVKGEG